MSKRKRGGQDGGQQRNASTKPKKARTQTKQGAMLTSQIQTVGDQVAAPRNKDVKTGGKSEQPVQAQQRVDPQGAVNGDDDIAQTGVSGAIAGKQLGAVEGEGSLPSKGGSFRTASFANKERVLLLCSRGITYRYRHLLTDLGQLLPHCKRDPKLDTKSDRKLINEIADLKNCTSSIFFECRKKKDLYVWVAKHPAGPTFKFYVTNVHTMAELKLSGNHLKGSRHVLSFSKEFDLQPHWQVAREALQQVFTVPRNHQKSKPFFDHVISFSIADERIWMRNYQIVSTDRKGEEPTLIEVGPRACLQPIRIFQGSYSGAVLYENPQYVSPNELRRAERMQAAGRYKSRVVQKKRRKEHTAAHQVPQRQFADLFK